MKKLILFGVLVLTLSACKNEENTMVCGNYNVDIEMSESGNSITAVINGDEMTLDLAISASGARYVGELNDAIVTLWNKGSDWTMFINDEEPIFCVTK